MPRISRGLLSVLRHSPPTLPSPSTALRSILHPREQRVTSLTQWAPTLFANRPIISTPLSSAILGSLQQLRHTTFGAEYQPSQKKRKRKHGFLARKRCAGGRRILKRRQAKGRKYLSH